MTAGARIRRRGWPSFAMAFSALWLGGCVSLAPSQISAMSSVDLCEFQDVQGRNLTGETSRAIESELERRKDNCRNHAAEVAQRREETLYQLVYGSPDDP